MVTLRQIATFMHADSILVLAATFDWKRPFFVSDLVAEFVSRGQPMTPEQLAGEKNEVGQNILRWMDFGSDPLRAFRRATDFEVPLYLNTGKPPQLFTDTALVDRNTSQTFVNIDDVPLVEDGKYEMYVMAFNLFGRSDRHIRLYIRRRLRPPSASAEVLHIAAGLVLDHHVFA